MVNRGYARYLFYGGLLAEVKMRTLEIIWYRVYGMGRRRYIGHWDKAYWYLWLRKANGRRKRRMIEYIRSLSTAGYREDQDWIFGSKDHVFNGINDENKGSIKDQQRVEMKSKNDRCQRKRMAFFQPAGQSRFRYLTRIRNSER